MMKKIVVPAQHAAPHIIYNLKNNSYGHIGTLPELLGPEGFESLKIF
jgi:hypothetical protein